MAKTVMLIFLMVILLATAFLLPRFVAHQVATLPPGASALLPGGGRDQGTRASPSLTVATREQKLPHDANVQPATAEPSAGVAPSAAPEPLKYDQIIRPFFASLANKDYENARKLIDENKETLGSELAASMLGALTAAESEHRDLEQFLAATKAAMETNSEELRKALDLIKATSAPKAAAVPEPEKK